MTPSTLNTYIRQRHNSIGDIFWSDDEIYNLMYGGCLELAREAMLIEQTYSTSTVIGTQSYAYPSNTIAIKRITWNGQKVQPVNFREDDRITGNNSATTSQGDPQFYYIWNETIYLRPIPSSVQSLVIYSFNEPSTISATSTFEIPSQFHIDLVDYVLSCMHAKEKNFPGSQYYREEWEKRVLRAKAWGMKRKRGDSYGGVQDIESMAETFVGTT